MVHRCRIALWLKTSFACHVMPASRSIGACSWGDRYFRPNSFYELRWSGCWSCFKLEKQLSLCRAIVGVPADVRIHQRERESTTVSSLTFPGFCFSNNCGESETTLVRKNETFSGNLKKTLLLTKTVTKHCYLLTWAVAMHAGCREREEEKTCCC